MKKCSVDGCPEKPKHKIRIRSNTLLGVTENDADLCDKHRDILLKGRSSAYSIGCSFKAEEGVCY